MSKSKREEIRERRRKQKKQQRMVTLMIVAGVALITVALIMIPTLQRAFASVDDFVQPEPFTYPMTIDNTMGVPNAPVVIEEFSDFGCSHCADFSQGTGKLIAQDYVATGQVYFISRSSGNLLNNPNTQLAAEAAYCAADQNKYWEYHDIVFANQATLFFSGITYIDNYLTSFADSLDLDMGQFNDCLKENQNRDRMLADGTDAQTYGINSTPSFIINGEMYRGNMPYEQFQSIIDAELAANQ